MTERDLHSEILKPVALEKSESASVRRQQFSFVNLSGADRYGERARY